MKRQSLARLTVMAVACGLLTMFAVGIAYSQAKDIPLDQVVFTYGKPSATTVHIKISIDASATKFLADPVQTLRQKGVAVPQSAEGPWREFTFALQRLANSEPPNPAIRKRPGRTKYWNIVLKRGFAHGLAVTIVCVGDADSKTAPAADAQSSNTNGWFITKPVVTLRAQGMSVPAAHERYWRQMAEALKALQLAYANPRVDVDRRPSADLTGERKN
jgi:hypothetical protein